MAYTSPRVPHWLPDTGLGRWAASFATAFLMLLLFGLIMAMSGQRGGERFSDNLLLAIPMLGAGLAAVMAGALAAAAIARGERSRIVYAVAAVGLLVLFFVAGELIAPH